MKHSKILKQSLLKLQDLKMSAKLINNKKGKLSTVQKEQELLNLAMKGVIISGFSEIERYIELFYGSWFDSSLVKNSYKSFFNGRSHENLKALFIKAVFESIFKNYHITNDETKLLRKLTNSTAFKGMTCDSNIPFLFTGKEIIAGKKYPSTKNIVLLAKRIGINDFFREMTNVKNSGWENKLDSLNTVRSSVAHRGELPIGYSAQDTINFIDSTADFLKTYESVMKIHLKKHLSSAEWKKCCKVWWKI